MRNICKTYDTGAVALDNVNIDIAKGEFVFILEWLTVFPFCLPFPHISHTLAIIYPPLFIK